VSPTGKGLTITPNSLAKSLFQRPNYNCRLKRYYPADLTTRFNWYSATPPETIPRHLLLSLNKRCISWCISYMPLMVTVNTIAECLRPDWNILGDEIIKKKVTMTGISDNMSLVDTVNPRHRATLNYCQFKSMNRVSPNNPVLYPFAHWKRRLECFSTHSSPISERALFCGRFPDIVVRPSGKSNAEMKTTGGMILTEKNQSTGRKISSSATLSITNLPWTDLGTKPGFRYDRPAINNLSHVMSISGCKKNPQVWRHKEHTPSKDQPTDF